MSGPTLAITIKSSFASPSLRLFKIHLMLLDYKMGGILGGSVAHMIKEYPGTKIILISAYNLDEDLVKELEENKYIAKYAEKPIHLANLIDLVANTIS